MIKYLYIILCLMLCLPAPLHAAKAGSTRLNLSQYQEADGAITTWHGSGVVDPYFATKALLIAKEAGLDIHHHADGWINWMLKIQRDDGLFERYKRDEQGNWSAYAAADADDAMLALWLQLLYSMAPDTGIPVQWEESMAKAEYQLARLYNPESGVYHISSTLPVGLLMDNIEIHAAFKSIAADMKRLGKTLQSREYADKAAQLHHGILNIFKPQHSTLYTVTTQQRNEVAFYPDKVAYIFALPYVFPNQKNKAEQYRQWIKDNKTEWFSTLNQNYPWGLLAVISLSMGDKDSAICWRNLMLCGQNQTYWNVLEEASLQIVQWQLRSSGTKTHTLCMQGVML